MPDAADFPTSASLFAPGELVVERLGWQLATWGGYLLAVSVWLLRQPESFFRATGAGTLALGAALAYAEHRRRQRPTALCARGPRLGVYRGGTLDREAKLSELVVFTVNPVNTLLFGAGQLSGVMIGAIPVLAIMSHGDSHMSALDVGAGLALSVASLSSLVSSIYTRHVWRSFRLPARGKIMAWEDLNLTGEQSAALLTQRASSSRP